MHKKTGFDFGNRIDSLLRQESVSAFEIEGKVLMNVFRDNFDKFEELIQFFSSKRSYAKKVGKTALGEIAKILIESGVTRTDGSELSANQISRYLSYVRKERAKVKSKTAPLPMDKTKLAIHHAVGGDLTRLESVTPPPSSGHKAVIGFIEPVPMSCTIPETLARLRRESKGGFTVDWNGYDVFTLRTLLYREYEKVKDSHISPTFFKVVNEYSFKFRTDALHDVLKLLTEKLKTKKIHMHYVDL